MDKYLIIDIGGSAIKYAIFNQAGKMLSKDSFAVPLSFANLKNKIIDLYKKHECKAISISSPGAINPQTGQGYGISAIDYIPSGGNLKAQLASELEVAVAIENDANCAALSEVYLVSKYDSIAYIVLGSGVGGSIVCKGQVVTGSQFFGGEFGYIPYRESSYSNVAGMASLCQKMSNISGEQLTGKDVFARADEQLEPYKTAVAEYYRAIADLIVILKYTNNPQAVIFAGAVTNRESFLSEVRAAINEVSNQYEQITINDVNIAISKFGSDANLYGAYANLVQNYSL